MELVEALKITGFEKCEFEPDSDPCEKCNATDKQLYYRRTSYWNEEGNYFCADCVVMHAEEINSVVDIKCSRCGDVFPGWPEQVGGICMDCDACDQETQMAIKEQEAEFFNA